MENFYSYIDRLQSAFTTTMRKLGPELSKGMELGLTGPQFFILKLVSKKDRWMVTELADKMSVKPSAITVMIDRLCQHGFVKRERDETDRRVVFIRITDVGLHTLVQAEEKRKQIMIKYLKHLSEEELETLVCIYEKLAQIVVETAKE